MGNIFRINCKRVYENGVYYNNNCEKIINIQKELKNIYDGIDNNWEGVDKHNFLVSFNKHIEDINTLINFLTVNSDLLKKNALEHSEIDNVFAAKMERSDINE